MLNDTSVGPVDWKMCPLPGVTATLIRSLAFWRAAMARLAACTRAESPGCTVVEVMSGGAASPAVVVVAGAVCADRPAAARTRKTVVMRRMLIRTEGEGAPFQGFSSAYHAPRESCSRRDLCCRSCGTVVRIRTLRAGLSGGLAA